MVTIYLKYGTYSGSTLTYSSASSFSALAATKRITRQIVINDTLRKNKTINKVFTRTYYDVKVGANVLSNSTNLTFFETFYKADAWQLSLDGTTYFNVVFDDEEFNLEYLEDTIYLPEWSVKLYKLQAD
jgi:hypothetical protein